MLCAWQICLAFRLQSEGGTCMHRCPAAGGRVFSFLLLAMLQAAPGGCRTFAAEGLEAALQRCSGSWQDPPGNPGGLGVGGRGSVSATEVRRRLLLCALHNLLFLKVFFLPKERRVAGSQPWLQAALCALGAFPAALLLHSVPFASCRALSTALHPGPFRSQGCLVGSSPLIPACPDKAAAAVSGQASRV